MDKEPIEDLNIKDDYYDKEYDKEYEIERAEELNEYRAQLMEDWIWS